jgi:hypothetical protein
MDQNDRLWTLDEFGCSWMTREDGSLAQVVLLDRRNEVLARFYAQSHGGKIRFPGFVINEEQEEAYVDEYKTESAAKKELLGVALLCRIARLEETVRVATAKLRHTDLIGDAAIAKDLLDSALAPKSQAFDDGLDEPPTEV